MAKTISAKIILDTNWYISASINRKSRRLVYNILSDKHFTIFYSRELLHEYQQVIRRRKFNRIISEPQVLRFLTLLLPRMVETEIGEHVNQSRDIKDNYLLAMALESQADYLVTGDRDLLVLEKIGVTKIVSMHQFRLEFGL